MRRTFPGTSYERNQHLIDHNATTKGARVRGAVRGGPSLLPGLLRCGHCGRKLHVRYGGQGGRVPRYECVSGQTNHGTERCISFGSWRVDQAMEQEILRVISPGAIEAALAEASTVMVEQADSRLALELEVQEARFEADRARRQYDRVEPENRLVATTLERRWDEVLQRVSELEQRLEALQARARRITCRTGRASWRWPTTCRACGRRRPRCKPRSGSSDCSSRRSSPRRYADPLARIALVVHWKGGKHTQLEVARPQRGQHRRSADKATLDVVRDLARSLPDNEIARVLNRLGHRTGTGQSWTQGRVTAFRNYHDIAVYQRTRGRPRVAHPRPSRANPWSEQALRAATHRRGLVARHATRPLCPMVHPTRGSSRRSRAAGRGICEVWSPASAKGQPQPAESR